MGPQPGVGTRLSKVGSRFPRPVSGSPWFPNFRTQAGFRFPMVSPDLKNTRETGEPQVPTPALNCIYVFLTVE